jgi:hypothetical protein
MLSEETCDKCEIYCHKYIKCKQIAILTSIQNTYAL